MFFHTLRIIPFATHSVCFVCCLALLPTCAGTIGDKYTPAMPLPPWSLSVASTGAVTVYSLEKTSVHAQDATSCFPGHTSNGAPVTFCQGETTQLYLAGPAPSYTLEIEAGSMTHIDDGSTLCQIAESMHEQSTVKCDHLHSDVLLPLLPELDKVLDGGGWNGQDDKYFQPLLDFLTNEGLENLPLPSPKNEYLNPPSSPTLDVTLGINAPHRLNVSRRSAPLPKVKPSYPRQSNSTVYKRFRCENCDYATDYKGSLTRHQKTHQPPGARNKPFRCENCDYATDRKDSLTVHQRTHQAPEERDKRFRCENCDYVTDKKGSLTAHQKIHQAPEERDKRFRCEKCNYATDKKGSLARHQRTHQAPGERDKGFRCENCDYSTDHKGTLTRHQKTHLTPGERDNHFRCENCDYATDRKGSLTRHQKIHQAPKARDKRFRCENCDYATDRKFILKAHQTTHQAPGKRDKPFR